MKKLLKNIATPLVASAIIVAGLAGAAATDAIPNPLPNAVAGNVIKASDINDMATAVGILDERSALALREDENGNVGINGIVGIGGTINVSGAAIVPGVDEVGTSVLELGLDYSLTPGSGPRKINFYPHPRVDGSGFGTASGELEYYTNGNHVFYTRPNRASVSDEYVSTQLMLLNSTTFRVNHLSGTGNAFACIDTSGRLYRSATACN